MKGKKLLAGVLSAAMVLGTMAFPAFADEPGTASPDWDGNSKATVFAYGANTDGNFTLYADTLTDALKKVYMKKPIGTTTIECKPNADVGSMQHGHVADNLIINGNDAYVSGGEYDLEIDTYTFDRTTGINTASTTPELSGEITVKVNNLNQIAAWGQRRSDATINLEFTDCENMNRVYFSGNTGTTNITINNCSFNDTTGGSSSNTSIYSNAKGEIALDNVSFKNVAVPINLRNKSNGTQTIIVKNCQFTNCATAEIANNTSSTSYAAPIRVITESSAIASNVTVENCSFTNSATAGNGTILLGDGRDGENSTPNVTLNISDTAAEIQVQEPGKRTTPTVKKTVTAEDNAVVVKMPAVEVSGVKIAEGKRYGNIQDAYNAIKAELEAKAGLSEQGMSEEDFNDFFTEGGKITWTISGEHKVTDSRMFSFGRAANRFGEGRLITEINIVGDENAVLDLSDVNGTFALPYNWWNVADSTNTALKCSNITFNGIKSMPSATYQCTLYPTTYEFDGCTFNGNLYSYQNFDVDMTIKNSTFNAPDNVTTYALMSQGLGGTITLDNNKIYGYTRGINLQRETADFIVTNNTIESDVSEPDRGAVQITDGKSFVVTGNTIDVSGGNAFWFHSAAKNSNVTYTISENNIKAPYLANDDTTFGVNDKITCIGNIYNDTDILNCMEKEATEATKSTVEAMIPVAQIGTKFYSTLKDAMQAACNMNVEDVNGIPTQTTGVTIDLIADIENQEGFSAYGGEPQNGYGWHFVHNVDITLNGNGHKIDTGVHGSNNADTNKSPNINVSSNNGKFTVKNVIAPNDLLFTVTKPGHATSDCKDEARAESLVVENCEFYGSNVGYDSTVNTVMYKNNKFLLTENENDHPDAYPLWYKFDWKITNFTFEGNTVKSQRALNLARFSQDSEIVINNNNFTIANSETPAKSAAIMLAENNTEQYPYNGNVTFNGNTVDAHSAVLVYAPSEYNTNFNLTAESNILANGTKLVGYNEWSGTYNDQAAKDAAEALINKVENKANGSEDVANTIGLKFKKHTDDETVYDIILSGEGKDINRLNAAEFKFELSTTKMAYVIKAADGMALIPQEDGKYEFHFDGKDAIGDADSDAKIVIGTVTFDGYDTFTFKATAGRATATTTSDNLVSEFVVGGAGGKGTLNIDGDDNKIEDEIKVPTQVLTINVLTNHNVGNNVAAYQDMTVAISGGNLAGNVLTYKLGNDNSDVTVATNVNGDVTSYQIKTELDQNKLYTVNVSGAGYRTARYTVTMNADKTLSVWNNVMSNEVTVVDDTKATTNFLAGDIVKDNSINIYDLSAVVAYFGTEMATNEYNKYAKYDLNRDGKIDIMDISMVLTSWGK